MQWCKQPLVPKPIVQNCLRRVSVENCLILNLVTKLSSIDRLRLKKIVVGWVRQPWQGRTLDCRIQDVRRALVYVSLLACHDSESPVTVVRLAVERCNGTCCRLGWFQQKGSWQACEANKTLLLAGLYVAGVCLNLQGTIGFRYGRNVRAVSAVSCDDSFLLWWNAGDMACWHHVFVPGTSHINLPRLTGLVEHNLCFAQFFMSDSLTQRP